MAFHVYMEHLSEKTLTEVIILLFLFVKSLLGRHIWTRIRGYSNARVITFKCLNSSYPVKLTSLTKLGCAVTEIESLQFS